MVYACLAHGNYLVKKAAENGFYLLEALLPAAHHIRFCLTDNTICSCSCFLNNFVATRLCNICRFFYNAFSLCLSTAKTLGKLGILCLSALLSLMTVTASAAGFSDVPAGKYYAKPVEWAVGKGITNGKTATTFAPNEKCTRAQIITFLWRAAGAPNTGSWSYYSDVADDAYYCQAANWATEWGIITIEGGRTDCSVYRL